MPRLVESLREWPSTGFEKTLKRELMDLPAGTLPLDRGATRCGIIDDSDISVVVMSTGQDEIRIKANIGVFFTEIVAGCVCGDDPSAENAYCEMLISIDKFSAEAKFEVISG